MPVKASRMIVHGGSLPSKGNKCQEQERQPAAILEAPRANPKACAWTDHYPEEDNEYTPWDVAFDNFTRKDLH